MDKLAELKSAEVAGVISGLIDTGYLKLASDAEFESLTEVVAGSISDNWDLNEVLNKTAEVIEYVNKEQEPVQEKTAEEDLYTSLADYGLLCLAKEAGEISEEDFQKEAAFYTNAMTSATNALGKLKADPKAAFNAARKTVTDAFTGKDLRDKLTHNAGIKGMDAPFARYSNKELLSAAAKPAAAAAVTGTTLVAGGKKMLGGKSKEKTASAKAILNKLRGE